MIQQIAVGTSEGGEFQEFAVDGFGFWQGVFFVNGQPDIGPAFEPGDVGEAAFGKDRLLVDEGVSRPLGVTALGAKCFDQCLDRQVPALRIVPDQILEVDAFDVRWWEKCIEAKLLEGRG